VVIWISAIFGAYKTVSFATKVLKYHEYISTFILNKQKFYHWFPKFTTEFTSSRINEHTSRRGTSSHFPTPTR
jgi:hypothetical protein